jgi:SAM-dependent methyltransferase
MSLGSDLERFVLNCAETSYTEGEDSIAFHSSIAKIVWDRVKLRLPSTGSVLDVGCANGFAMKMFMADGWWVTGLTTNIYDIDDPNLQNMALERDMHQIGTFSSKFDLIWARHVMEHSPVPLFLLQEMKKVLATSGFVYIEVPSPSTPCLHWTNANHYSCFSREGWQGLINKAGFEVLETFDVNVKVPAGDDVYFCWLLKAV